MQRVLIESVEGQLKDIFARAIASAFPTVNPSQEALVTPGRRTEFQCNNVMGLVKNLQNQGQKGVSPLEVGKQLVMALPQNDMIQSCEPSKEGFINIVIRPEWVANSVHQICRKGLHPAAMPKEKVLVDFSSPNIAKDMHVGHLRSTIIGESICRMYEYAGHEVSRINHLGDWGTQFGMLILYLKESHPDFLINAPPIKDLVQFYKSAKKKFDEDAAFKENARQEVVKLQAGQADSVAAWKQICDISRAEFEEVYQRLQVRLDARGESFYNDLIPKVVQLLEEAGFVTISDGAKIIVSKQAKSIKSLDVKDLAKLLPIHFALKKKDGSVAYNDVLLAELKRVGNLIDDPEGGGQIVAYGKGKIKLDRLNPQHEMEKLAAASAPLLKPTISAPLLEELRKSGAVNDTNQTVDVPRFAFPLMVVKSNGAYTYDTTDLAAMYHRFVIERNTRVIYVTDVGQFEHFRMLGQTAADVGWIDQNAKWQHAGFGLVSGADGKKLKTRSGEATKLKDLLDEARDRMLVSLREREAGEHSQGHPEAEMHRLAQIVGYGAVKYFDLKQNRLTDYTFEYDAMLDLNGNTAVFLLYSYARICSIKRKGGPAAEELIRTCPKVEFTTDTEKHLGLALLRFPSVLLKAMEQLYPHLLADYAYDLVGKFNGFYAECPVLNTPQMASRLVLCEVVGITLQKALDLLGIEVVEKL